MLLTDARKNEFLRAKWADVDWYKRQLRSPRDTPGKQRMIELPDEAIAILRELEGKSSSEWIFPGRNPEQPLSSLNPFWLKFRKEMGMGQMKIDDLRFNNIKNL